jgi:DNA-binding PadR family transcriptional regulator
MMSAAIDVSAKPTVRAYDKRSRVDLELFLIALVKREINTPYALHHNVGLSPGATIPVLKKLELDGDVRRGTPGPRRRAEYQTTPAGDRRLNSGWQALLEAPIPTDIDAILRIASLGLLSGAAPKRIAAYLRRAAAANSPDSKLRKLEEELSRKQPQAVPYAWMKAAHLKARRAAEGKLLLQLASGLLKRSEQRR